MLPLTAVRYWPEFVTSVAVTLLSMYGSPVLGGGDAISNARLMTSGAVASRLAVIGVVNVKRVAGWVVVNLIGYLAHPSLPVPADAHAGTIVPGLTSSTSTCTD